MYEIRDEGQGHTPGGGSVVGRGGREQLGHPYMPTYALAGGEGLYSCHISVIAGVMPFLSPEARILVSGA
jgi:hypothetical protein